jgi:hypothetical protein
MAKVKCDVCGKDAPGDTYSSDGYWTVCDVCWNRAPQYVRDFLAGITLTRKEDAERYLRKRGMTLR